MNRALAFLADLCRKYRLDEKHLFVPSYSIGHQVGESLSKSGHPWINLRITTPSGYAQTLTSTDPGLEAPRSGFRRMRDHMLDHGLDQPLIATDMGYFQVTFPGPGKKIERLRVPENRLLVTPAVETRLNGRQRAMVSLLVQGEVLTSRRCGEECGVTRDTASRDFSLLLELGLAMKEGQGRSTRYVLAVKP